MMRQAGLATRISSLKTQEETMRRIRTVEQHLTALRLALPPNWLNPKRNIFTHESYADHHARLVTVLHLFMMKLILSILRCSRQQGEE
jgi:hypothetical protein